MGGLAIVVFSDLVDSTALLVRLGDDRMEAIRRSHMGDVASVVDVAGGRVVKTLGDGAMATFESALGALRAAAGIQATVERLDVAHGGIGIAARVGVAAGEPIAHEDDLHGMAVVIASRLCAAAESGQVLVQDLVHQLVASRDGVALDDPSTYDLKGVPAPVRASRLRWRDLPRPPPSAGGADWAPGATDPAAEAIGATDAVPLPALLAAYAREPLIGREREIGMLRDATRANGGCRAVLVLGEPGIGKTRHAAAAAADAHARGELVVLARCPPETVVAFEPWVRGIGELARAGDAAWRRGLARAAGPELAVLVPELSEHMAQRADADAGLVVAAEGARYRLLHGVASALAHAAGTAPLHVVLDDAHWCDAASAQALGHLLESAPTGRLVLVVTARERELGRRHPVSRTLADLRRTSALSELRLEGLDAGGMAALVAARVGRAITPRLAERLRARTAGNPFFAAELARDLEEQGVLRDGAGLQDAPVPDAVTDLVEERLARLEPVTERLLVAAAAIGPAARLSLAAGAAGISDADAERAVAQALSERLVDEVPASQPTIAFPHALIREALAAGVGEAERARLHLAIATALEQAGAVEPVELARHYGQAVAIVGPELAIAAYRNAARAAADGHDHEQAATQLRSALALLSSDDLAARAPLLLELGEQELLVPELLRAREAFQGAADAARSIGDAGTLAQAALGFAGGDISFGVETNSYDEPAVRLLREGLDALGEQDPRLALRMCFRLCFALIFTDDEHQLSSLGSRAQHLDRQLNDAESRLLARTTAVLAIIGRSSEPMNLLPRIVHEFLDLAELAQECGREDLRFRIVQWSTFGYYTLGRIAECEAAVEHAAEIADRLGSPRFTWEVDYIRAQRRLDRGDRDGAEVLIRRAGRTLRRLRPNLQMSAELLSRVAAGWIYDGKAATNRAVFDTIDAHAPWGMMAAIATLAAAREGDYDTARRRLETLLAGELNGLRRPDGHMPPALCFLAHAAILTQDRRAGARLRQLLEPLRPYVISMLPATFLGQLPGWHIGRLELLAGNADAAVAELQAAVAAADEHHMVWQAGEARVDLAIALHRRNRDGDSEQARRTLAEAKSIAERYEMRLVVELAASAHAELDGVEPPCQPRASGHERPMRGFTVRTGRRALAALVRGSDDEAIEVRFADPRRQRALLRALVRGFQPAHSGGFTGVIAYELEPQAIQTPPDAPWRWAIQVDSRTGRAQLLDPAPLDAAVTIYMQLADWVQVLAGIQNAVTVMASGRLSVDGDVMLAVRLEAMFGALNSTQVGDVVPQAGR